MRSTIADRRSSPGLLVGTGSVGKCFLQSMCSRIGGVAEAGVRDKSDGGDRSGAEGQFLA